MTGTIAQLIALISYGNYYLATGKINKDFYPSNSTFQYCKVVNFATYKRTEKKIEETLLAKNPIEWFEMLKKNGCTKLRLCFYYSQDQSFSPDYKMAGMVGGGGRWIIETMYIDYSDYWENRWEVKDPNAADKKIWTVSYGVPEKHYASTNQQYNIDSLKESINKTLAEISEFAYFHSYNNWGDTFKKAKELLYSSDPSKDHYHKDFIVIENYSLTAQQILFSSGNAFVFGGMGSWIDISFQNKEDEKKYNELSERLYDNIVHSIVAATNSY